MDKTHQNTAVGNGNESLSKLLRHSIPAILYGFCGYFAALCEFPFSAYPFGVALLASANKNVVFILAGSLISTVLKFDGTDAIVRAGIYIALILLRVLIRLTVDKPDECGKEKSLRLGDAVSSLFEEHIGYRACTAAIAAFSLSLVFLVSGGFLYYDMFGLLISTAIAPLACILLGNYFTSEEKKEKSKETVVKIMSGAGFILLCSICVYGASGLKIYGVSIPIFVGIISVLLSCRKYGWWYGVLLGLGVGVASSFKLIPMFALCAICYVLFSRFSVALVTTTALLSASAYAFYALGIRALDGTFGGIISSSLLFGIIVKLTALQNREVKEKSRLRCTVLDESELDVVRLRDANRRMSAMSEGFAHLSELFDSVRAKFPKKAELRSICDRAFEASCVGCAEYMHCKSKLDGGEAERLAELLDRHRKLEVSDMCDDFVAKCGRLPDIADEINYNYGVRFVRGDRRDECDDEFFDDDYGYKALSSLLGKSMEEENEEYISDREASSSLCDEFDRLNVGITGVIVYGKRRKRVYIKGNDRKMLDSAIDLIAATIKDTIGTEFETEGVCARRSGRDDEGNLEMSEKKHLDLSIAARNETAIGSDRCGDNIDGFENRDGRYFCVISDGMGSGRDAALVSELTVGFLRNMLSDGKMNRELLCMLNSFLQMRGGGSARECSATLDLLEIDLVSGRTTFFKSGSAPSYVYRNGNLFKVRSRALPLGILHDADTRNVDFDLQHGDVVVMMSDGVTGGREDCPYLFDLLRQNIDSAGVERIADLIMKYAKSNKEPDDISLCVIRIE